MIGRILTFFTETIFRRNINEYRNPVVRWLVQQYKLLFYSARGLIEHNTMVHSAALTFYTLMSIVPIAAVIFAIVKGFGLADGMLANLYAAFPQNQEIIEYIVSFAERALARTHDGVMASVALIMLFWAVISVFSSIENAFNNIWEVKITRSVARQYTDYIAIVVVVPLLWISAHAMGIYAQQLLGINASAGSVFLVKSASMVVAWVLFTFLYMAIPNTKVRIGSAFTAGVVAGTCFVLFQWGYVYLQQWMSSYNAIYGSFAALPLFLVWMQTSWQILLFGGELSFAYQNIEKFGEERESLLISYDQRRKVMLAVMLVIVRHFRDAGGTITADDIRHQLNLPTRIVNDVLYQLVTAKLLIAVHTDDTDKAVAFTPARAINTLTIYGVIEAAEGHGQTSFDLATMPEMQRVDEEFEKIKNCARSSHENLHLTDLL
ncbi:MAG: YhjD/YihY/BrkB family envelope integrity protein [Alistipes sp.]